MLRLAFAASFALASSEASAIVRYMVQDMTCTQVQQALERDGVAILYRQGKSGVTLYDRFVANGSHCATGFSAAREGIGAFLEKRPPRFGAS